MNIFVSYTTRNNEVTIDTLTIFSNKIQKFGNIFIDLLDNNSLDQQARIIEELMKSDILALIKSTSTYNSEWVKIELEIAKKMSIPIVEFEVDEIERLSEEEIRLRFFSEIK